MCLRVSETISGFFLIFSIKKEIIVYFQSSAHLKKKHGLKWNSGKICENHTDSTGLDLLETWRCAVLSVVGKPMKAKYTGTASSRMYVFFICHVSSFVSLHDVFT